MIRCLYSAVSLTLVTEQRFIRISTTTTTTATRYISNAPNPSMIHVSGSKHITTSETKQQQNNNKQTTLVLKARAGGRRWGRGKGENNNKKALPLLCRQFTDLIQG